MTQTKPLIKILCSDLRVGDWIQDEQTHDMFPVIKVTKSMFVVDARTACDCEDVITHLGFTFDPASEEFGHRSCCRENGPPMPADLAVRFRIHPNTYVNAYVGGPVIGG